MLLEKSGNVLELCVKQLVIQSRLISSISLGRQERNWNEGGGGGLTCPFSKIGKNCPKFVEKIHWSWLSWFKFLI